MQIHDTLNIKLFTDILIILLGCFIVAIGFTYFINPYHLVPGGVFGASLVVHSFIPSLQVGTITMIFEVPLLILSAVCLGTNLGVRTLVASFAAPAMINILGTIGYDSVEALQSLDPTHLFGGAIDMTNDKLLTCIIGGAIVGIGETFIIRTGASSGGTDIIAMIMHKYCKTKFTPSLLFVDGVILLSGLLVIGFGVGLDADTPQGSWLLSFYALITMIVMNRSLAWGLAGNRDCKLIHIVCEEEKETVIREWILHTLDRTATTISAKGLYSEDDKQLLLMAVRDKEVSIITDQIRRIAPGSFVIVTDSYDVYGFRWSELPENNGMDFK